MELPQWVVELRERYLGEAGNAFLLHGATRGPIWHDDLDCEHVLRRFLGRTRPVVGILRPSPLPSRLEFADMADRVRFETLIKAIDLVEGRPTPTDESAPALALARIWRALGATGTDQAYLLTDAERIAPGHRRSMAPIADAPSILEWPDHERLRRSNNVLLLLAKTPEGVRAELRERCVVVEVRDERPAPAEPPPALSVPTPTPAPELRAELAEALAQQLAAHPAEHRAALLPVMEAVAVVLARSDPRLSVPRFALGPEGAEVTGPGADQFLALWRSDIALDAAASMVVRNLEGGIDPTAVAALARRVQRLLQRT